MIKILHISDMHIGHNGNEYYIKLKEMFENVVNNNYLNDHYLIVTGDLIDDDDDILRFDNPMSMEDIELTSQEAAMELLSIFNEKVKKILIIPGNHDYYKHHGTSLRISGECNFCIERFNIEVYGANAKSFPILTMSDDNNVAFIGLNSAHAGFVAEGKIGSEQLNDLKMILERDKIQNAEYVIIYLHHHPVITHMGIHSGMKLVDANELLDIIEGKVDLVLFGHRHNWVGKTQERGITFINSGSTSGKNCDYGSGIGLIEISYDREITFTERWDYNS